MYPVLPDQNNKLQKANVKLQNSIVIYEGNSVNIQPENVMLRCADCMTVAKAANSYEMSLAVINKENGRKAVINYISEWIIEFNEFVNIKNKMTIGQVKITAHDIYDSYHYMKLSDINLIFKNARKGIYGQLYESIDGVKILGWFEQYAKERFEHFESKLQPSRVDTSGRTSEAISISEHTKKLEIFKINQNK